MPFQGVGHQKGYDQFNRVLLGLLQRVLDTNKRVQEAACSAFATLEEVSPVSVLFNHKKYDSYQCRVHRFLNDGRRLQKS